MENYTKGEVKEVAESPVFPLQEDTGVEMKVNSGSKIKNLMGFAMKKIKEPNIRHISWNGTGNAITKTISCAEIMKRKIKGLHQITKIRYRRIEEYWEPKVEGLERLKVNKDIPAISILLSKDSLDSSEPGYQGPGSFDEFWNDVIAENKKPKGKRKTLCLTGAALQDHTGVPSEFRRKKKKPGQNYRKDSRNQNQSRQNNLGLKKTLD
ncbi:hypothetical protein CHS0354_026029 [Potamilus streckersoni]|uniref:DNA/RNA-binding protein Alba-like domain-containing protein n=1 Tax=Potamilus streckersoni TaxID=2493646 RepID=A0AAE0SB17_9BIVA|nr:hypothetical protein CHS0354_026029 [Potamilus streckersoni]